MEKSHFGPPECWAGSLKPEAFHGRSVTKPGAEVKLDRSLRGIPIRSGSELGLTTARSTLAANEPVARSLGGGSQSRAQGYDEEGRL